MLDTSSFDLQAWRVELLALTYLLGAIAVLVAWIVDPRIVGNRVGLGVLLGFVFASAVAMYLLRARLGSWAGDVAILGSLVLIDIGMFFTDLHRYPMLLSPFYVWVGFASPLWFPRRRAATYVLAAAAASGLVLGVAGTTAAVAGWAVTMATLASAFFITNFLTEALVRRERLAIVGEMASVVGHDLRNPLGAMSNILFLLRYDLGRTITEEQDRHLSAAEREIQKVTAIVGHLGSFVRHTQPVAAPIDVGALIAEVLEVTPRHQR
ncbi:MAG: histidine kinase dimerization/phospho-acceptor domain-containing protein [Acidimicrobiales bacterium]